MQLLLKLIFITIVMVGVRTPSETICARVFVEVDDDFVPPRVTLVDTLHKEIALELMQDVIHEVIHPQD